MSEYVADTNRKTRMKAEFIEYFPAADRDVFIKQFCVQYAPVAFKENISLCQCFIGRLKDVRRRNNVMYRDKDGIMTAISFQAAMLLDGTRVPAERTCMPRCIPILLEEAPAAEEDGEEEAGGEIVEASADIDLAVKIHRGWQTSYRRVCPESRPFRSWSKRFSRMRLRWEKTGKVLAPAHNQSWAARSARQAEWRSRRKKAKPA